MTKSLPSSSQAWILPDLATQQQQQQQQPKDMSCFAEIELCPQLNLHFSISLLPELNPQGNMVNFTAIFRHKVSKRQFRGTFTRPYIEGLCKPNGTSPDFSIKAYYLKVKNILTQPSIDQPNMKLAYFFASVKPTDFNKSYQELNEISPLKNHFDGDLEAHLFLKFEFFDDEDYPRCFHLALLQEPMMDTKDEEERGIQKAMNELHIRGYHLAGELANIRAETGRLDHEIEALANDYRILYGFRTGEHPYIFTKLHRSFNLAATVEAYTSHLTTCLTGGSSNTIDGLFYDTFQTGYFPKGVLNKKERRSVMYSTTEATIPFCPTAAGYVMLFFVKNPSTAEDKTLSLQPEFAPQTSQFQGTIAYEGACIAFGTPNEVNTVRCGINAITWQVAIAQNLQNAPANPVANIPVPRNKTIAVVVYVSESAQVTPVPNLPDWHTGHLLLSFKLGNMHQELSSQGLEIDYERTRKYLNDQTFANIAQVWA